MTWNRRPLSVTILAWVYIGVGTIGFVSHFTEIHARNAFQYDGILIEVVEVLAIVEKSEASSWLARFGDPK